MAEVLSQSEIDALLAAVSSGSVATQEAKGGVGAPQKDWIAYDLTSHEKIVRGRLAALQGIHERFSRLFRATLSQALKRNITVNCTNTDFIRFSDYLSNVMVPTSLNIVEMANLRGHMIFVMSSKLTYSLVDAYYGGNERPFSKIGGREEFTSIENNMIKKICTLAVKDMQEAWRLNYPVELKQTRSESNPNFVGSIHGSETVAVVTFEVEFENLSGPFVVIVQVKALDPIQSHLSINITGEVSAEVGRWESHWLAELGSIELDMRAELGSTTKHLSEINELKTGDVVALGEDAGSAIAVFIEGVPKLKGLMGVCKGNKAVRLTDFLKTAPSIENKK